MRLGGLFRVTRNYHYDESRIWDNGIYPNRVNIEGIIDSASPIDIKDLFRTAINPLLLGKGNNSGTASGYFGQGIRPLPADEFRIFEEYLRQNVNKEGSGPQLTKVVKEVSIMKLITVVK